MLQNLKIVTLTKIAICFLRLFLCFTYLGGSSYNWKKYISWHKLWNQYAHQVKCTVPKSYRIYFWYQKAYAYLFYKKNLASQVLWMMHGRHLFFPFLKTWVETREGRSTNSMWANPCHKKTHLNMSLERTKTKIYKALTGPSLHSVGFVNHNGTKMQGEEEEGLWRQNCKWSGIFCLRCHPSGSFQERLLSNLAKWLLPTGPELYF